MTNLQSSVDPAFSMFLEERRKEEKARADRARILRATSKNRNKRTTGVGRIDRAKTDAINARRSEMNVNQTSGTAAQRAATADRQANRRAPEHHVVTDASGNQTSVLGPRPESVQTPNSDQAFPTEASMTPRNVSQSIPMNEHDRDRRVRAFRGNNRTARIHDNLKNEYSLSEGIALRSYNRGKPALWNEWVAAHEAAGLHPGAHAWNLDPFDQDLDRDSGSARNDEIRGLREDFLLANRRTSDEEFYADINDEELASRISMLRRIQAAEEDENRREGKEPPSPEDVEQRYAPLPWMIEPFEPPMVQSAEPIDEVNKIMRMLEEDPGGVSNPNPNMMFSNMPSERDNLFTPEVVLNESQAGPLRDLLLASPFAGIDLYPDVISDVVGGAIDVGSSAARGIGDGLNYITGDVLDLLDPTPQVQVGDLPETKGLRASIAEDRAKTDEIVKAMPDAVDQFYNENGYVPSSEDLLAYVTGGF